MFFTNEKTNKMNDPNYAETLTREEITRRYDIVKSRMSFYCLSFQNEERTQSMKNRFAKIGLDLNVFEGVSVTDQRIADISGVRETTISLKRLWSVTYGHLENIKSFYNSNKDYAIICENDVMVNKNTPLFLPQIMEDFEVMDLDILLVGYMTTFVLKEWFSHYSLKHDFPDRPYKFLNYPNDQWGIHGLMLGKKGAKLLLDTFYDKADLYVNDQSGFSPDWTLTKIGNRALITPMLIVEDGTDDFEHYSDHAQHNYHINNFKMNFVPDLFV